MRLSRRNPFFRGAAATLLLLLLPWPGGAAPGATAPAKEKAFRAQWSVAGTIQDLDFGQGRRVGSFRLQGNVNLVRADGKVRDFWATCVGLRDTQTGTVTRCIWYDAADADRIFSELSGNMMGRSGKGHGTFAGGTGKYAGIRGSYEVQWISMVSREDGSLQANSVDMSGHWRLP